MHDHTNSSLSLQIYISSYLYLWWIYEFHLRFSPMWSTAVHVKMCNVPVDSWDGSHVLTNNFSLAGRSLRYMYAWFANSWIRLVVLLHDCHAFVGQRNDLYTSIRSTKKRTLIVTLFNFILLALLGLLVFVYAVSISLNRFKSTNRYLYL